MMNNVISYNDGIGQKERLYLYFFLGGSKYAVNVQEVVEIMKLPTLDYPQKLPADAVGLLNYNNFTINVLDLRFYLDIAISSYSVSNRLLIVKTDESIFGLLIDNVGDIISLDESKIEYFKFQNETKVIDFLYKERNETISVINLYALENILKEGKISDNVDIPSLFPTDEDSKSVFTQRSLALTEKNELSLAADVFSQNRFTCFALDGSNYCMNLEYVKEFLKNSVITPIPCDLDYIKGVITLRGDFVAVIDIKKFLGISNSETDEEAKKEFNNIIVLEASDCKIAFLVDKIFEIKDISEELINRNRQEQKYILSEVVLNDKIYNILNMKNILSDEKLFIEE